MSKWWMEGEASNAGRELSLPRAGYPGERSELVDATGSPSKRSELVDAAGKPRKRSDLLTCWQAKPRERSDLYSENSKFEVLENSKFGIKSNSGFQFVELKVVQN